MASLENDVARLERALVQGLNIDLAEFDDPDQAKERKKVYLQDQKDAADQLKAQEEAAAEAADGDEAAADEPAKTPAKAAK